VDDYSIDQSQIRQLHGMATPMKIVAVGWFFLAGIYAIAALIPALTATGIGMIVALIFGVITLAMAALGVNLFSAAQSVTRVGLGDGDVDDIVMSVRTMGTYFKTMGVLFLAASVLVVMAIVGGTSFFLFG